MACANHVRACCPSAGALVHLAEEPAAGVCASCSSCGWGWGSSWCACWSTVARTSSRQAARRSAIFTSASNNLCTSCALIPLSNAGTGSDRRDRSPPILTEEVGEEGGGDAAASSSTRGLGSIQGAHAVAAARLLSFLTSLVSAGVLAFLGDRVAAGPMPSSLGVAARLTVRMHTLRRTCASQSIHTNTPTHVTCVRSQIH